MKKFCLIFVVLSLFVFAGCGSSKSETKNDDKTDPGETVNDDDPTDSAPSSDDSDTTPDTSDPASDEDKNDTAPGDDADPAPDTGDTDTEPADTDTGDTDNDFEAVDVGECRHEEPAFALRDRIYTDGSYWCNEYVEVTEKAENSIRFNWFGEMHCGEDWEYGYKVEGIAENVLKVNILERDTDEIAVDCDNCCYLMPIEYTASSAEEIESVKTIEINYEGKNHTAYFEIK